MCGLIWLPSPSVNRPCDATCRSLATTASVIGVRANAMATPVDTSSRSVALRREQQREERVVAGLGGDAAVVAIDLEAPSGPRGVVQRSTQHPVHADARTLSACLSHPRGTV